jgi:hypothetical protein
MTRRFPVIVGLFSVLLASASVGAETVPPPDFLCKPQGTSASVGAQTAPQTNYLCKPQPASARSSADAAATSPDYLCQPQPATVSASAGNATIPLDYLCKPVPVTAPAGAETATTPSENRLSTAPNPPSLSADAIPTQEYAPMLGAARAAMLIASADNPQRPVVSSGSTVWSLIPAAAGQPATIAVKADADIPDLKMHATMTLRKNTDPTLHATHTIDLKFSFADGARITGFKDVGLPQLRVEDSTTAEALTSVKVKISDTYFLIALAKGDSDTARNLDLMRTRAWFDLPLLLNDDRIAKIVFQKSIEGQAMLDRAFEAWKSETPAQLNTDTSAPSAPAPTVPTVPPPAPASADTATGPAAQTYRFSLVGVAGNTLILGQTAGAVNPDCTPSGKTFVRISRPPRHGVVNMHESTGFSHFATMPECNSRKMDGVTIEYVPNRGFTGSDEYEADVISQTGHEYVVY